MWALLFVGFLARYGSSPIYFQPFDSTSDMIDIKLQYVMISGDERLDQARVVWDTWGKTIEESYFVILSDSFKKINRLYESLPIRQVMSISPSLPSHEKYRLSQLKWLYGLRLAHSQQFDWLIFLDDDTFIIHHSLTKLLSQYNASKSLMIGKVGEPACHFICGGAGIAMSRKLVTLLNTNYSQQLEREFHSIISSNSTHFHSDVILSHFIHRHQIGSIIHREEFKNFPPDVGMKWYLAHNRTPSTVVSYHRLTPEQYAEFYLLYYQQLAEESLKAIDRSR
jgi:hypothetical protein